MPGTPTCSYLNLDLGEISYKNMTANFRGEFICPRRTASNMHVSAAQEQHVQWCTAIKLIPKSNLIKLNQARFAALFPTTLRDHSVAECQLMADFCALLFALDDLVDKMSVAQSSHATQEFKNLFAAFMAIINDKSLESNQISPKYLPFITALTDIMSRLRQKTQNLSYFSDSVEEIFRGCLWEIDNRNSSIPLSEASYFHLRRMTGAAKPIFEFACLLKGLELSEEDRKNPILGRVLVVANDLICIMNDIISFKKEIDEDKHTNIIQCKLDKFFNDTTQKKTASHFNFLERAYHEALKLHNQEMHDFISFQQDFSHSPTLSQFYQLLSDCVRDNIDWSLKETRRYRQYYSTFAYQEREASLPSQYKIALSPNNLQSSQRLYLPYLQRILATTTTANPCSTLQKLFKSRL